MDSTRLQIPICIIGNANTGKSTLAGHLLFKCGHVLQSDYNRRECELNEKGKSNYKFSWIVDKWKAEREYGFTLDFTINLLHGANNDIILIDTPGKRKYIKNMVSGTSNCDYAILVISAIKSEFNSEINENSITFEHCIIAYTMGIRKIIVCINKIDDSGVDFTEEYYQQIIKIYSEILHKIGFKTTNITFIPISAWIGYNLTEKSIENAWYKGPCLLDLLNLLTPIQHSCEKPLRLAVHDSYLIRGIGTVVIGKIHSGIAKAGMVVQIGPKNIISDSFTIESFYMSLKKAKSGYIIGINIRHPDYEEIKRGFVLGDYKNDPPKACKSFIAQIILIKNSVLIRTGYSPIIDCHTAHIQCKFEKILAIVDKKTAKELEKLPEFIQPNESALVKLVPKKPICVEPYNMYPGLGRFLVRDHNEIIAVGVIKSVEF